MKKTTSLLQKKLKEKVGNFTTRQLLKLLLPFLEQASTSGDYELWQEKERKQFPEYDSYCSVAFIDFLKSILAGKHVSILEWFKKEFGGKSRTVRRRIRSSATENPKTKEYELGAT